MKGGAETYTLFCQVSQAVLVLFMFQMRFIMTELSGQIMKITWMYLSSSEVMKIICLLPSIIFCWLSTAQVPGTVLDLGDTEAVRCGPCTSAVYELARGVP